MKVYVRAPYEEACLAELKELFDEVVYEPWTTTGQRYYEDEMLEHLLAVQPDALITELDRVTEKVLAGYDRLKFIGDCRGTPANLQVDACTKAGVPILCTPGRNTQAVAEMVVGLILTMYRKTIPAIQWVQRYLGLSRKRSASLITWRQRSLQVVFAAREISLSVGKVIS